MLGRRLPPILAIAFALGASPAAAQPSFVTFESAFWEVSYNIAHVMHFLPVSISSAAAIRHMQELLDEPTRGADRPAAPRWRSVRRRRWECRCGSYRD